MKMDNCIARLAVFAALLFACSSSAAPPPNDDFANRTVLAGTDISFQGTLAEATSESTNEVNPPLGYWANPVTQTVWWGWSPTEDTTAIIQILSSSKETHGYDGLGVYIADGVTNGQLIAGVTLDSVWPVMFLTFPACAGTNYQIQLAGSDSASYSFRLVATNSPFIVQHPQTQTVSTNDSVMFGVVAAGYRSESESYESFDYQWQFNGTNLVGETGAILGLNHITTNQMGAYRVFVSNEVGTATSEAAQLFVTPTDNASTLVVTQPQNFNEFQFTLLGEVGRRYRIESSTNLTDWSPEMSFPSIFNYYNDDLKSVVFNSTGADSFTVEIKKQQHFFRASPFHALNEECNNNLKQLRFAHMLYAYDQGFEPFTGADSEGIISYLNGQWVVCPSWGTYTITTVSENPTCSVHPFEER